MMNDSDDGMRLTAREWLAARVVIIGGFALAILVAAYFTWSQHEQMQQEAAAQQAQEQAAARAAATPSPQAVAQARARIGLILCLRELVNAQTMGVIPNFGKLTNGVPQATSSRGRYACGAGTDVAKYTLVGDLVCRDLRKAECVNLYSVTSDDGTVLYQRRK